MKPIFVICCAVFCYIGHSQHNSQFTLKSEKSIYEDFLPQNKLMDLCEFYYPELLLNMKEAGTTGIIDSIEVKANFFKLQDQKFDFAYSQIRFYQKGKPYHLFVVHFPDDTGYLDPKLGFCTSDGESIPCEDCYLLDIAIEKNRIVTTFATDRTMTRLYTKDMTYDVNTCTVKWSEVNDY